MEKENADVTIIIADIEKQMCEENAILSQIAPCYVKKFEQHKIQQDAKQELIAGLLLKQYLGIERDEQLCYNKYQKPYLASKEHFFNLSHSGKLVVLAIADRNIGIDVEKIMQFHEPTAKKIYSVRQREKLAAMTGDTQNEYFTKMWTAYEAMLKLKGCGFEEEWDKEIEPADECCIYTDRINDHMISIAAETELIPQYIEWTGNDHNTQIG